MFACMVAKFNKMLATYGAHTRTHMLSLFTVQQPLAIKLSSNQSPLFIHNNTGTGVCNVLLSS